MSIETYMLAGCAWAVAIVCGILVFHPHYATGVIRTVGLATIAIAGFSRGVSLLTYTDVEVSRVGVLVWVGLALFFFSHFRGFTRRYKRRGPSWYDGPDSGKHQAGG